MAEGVILAAYRYPGITAKPDTASRFDELTVVSPASRAVETGVRQGAVTARAATLARDLANTPPAHLNARDIADLAVSLGQRHGFGVEVFDNDDLVEMGCGGCLLYTSPSPRDS